MFDLIGRWRRVSEPSQRKARSPPRESKDARAGATSAIQQYECSAAQEHEATKPQFASIAQVGGKVRPTKGGGCEPGEKNHGGFHELNPSNYRANSVALINALCRVRVVMMKHSSGALHSEHDHRHPCGLPVERSRRRLSQLHRGVRRKDQGRQKKRRPRSAPRENAPRGAISTVRLSAHPRLAMPRGPRVSNVALTKVLDARTS